MFTNSRHARVHHPPRGIQVACAQLQHQSTLPLSLSLALLASRCLSIFLSPSPSLSPSLVRSNSELAVHSTEMPGGIPCSPILAMRGPTIHQAVCKVACDQLKHQSKHPNGQPSELVLFPKVTDACSRCRLGDQRPRKHPQTRSSYV